ncbi:MAG: dephospho-CoA kinase [Bacteroidaceae bacterium]|nr:dephospho-CoA kinase [Bacteroidaceae bacterium]
MGNCIKLAITGGIGSGKSVVSHIMEIMGVPVYDCDRRAKELMVTDVHIVKGLTRMFGSECYNEDGTLNRGYVASRIFTDDDNIKRVNALVHPIVKKNFERWAASMTVPVVAVETAVLYESGIIESVDKVLVVWADKETCIRRTIKRSGMSRNQVVSRMQKQMSSDELLLLSDYSLYNDGEEPLLKATGALLDELRGGVR